MRIRIYFPRFPLEEKYGIRLTIINQIRVLCEQGHDVELVSWLSSPNDRAGIHPRLRLIQPWTQDGMTPELPVTRSLRVLKSYFSTQASPEQFFYPLHVLDSFQGRLGEADLGIYHYSFAHAWLQSSAKRLEKRRVVYFHNLESELFRLRAHHSIGFLQWPNIVKLTRHEVQLTQLADELWFVSARDEALLRERSGSQTRAVMRQVPPCFPKEFLVTRRRAVLPGPKPIYGFMGLLDFEPNALGVDWILSELCPRLKKGRFDGEIWIAGEGSSSRWVSSAQVFPFVKFLGYVKDADSFWAHLTGMLVPHLGGSGVRMKLLEALASGVPAIAHREVLASLGSIADTTPGLFLSDDPGSWVERLLAEDGCARRQQVSGLPVEEFPWLDTNVYSFLF